MPRTRHSTDFFSSPRREFADRYTRREALARVLIEPATDAPEGRRW